MPRGAYSKLILWPGGGAGVAGAASSVPAGLTANWAIKTANYTMTTNDYGIVCNSASTFTLTLLNATTVANRVFRFENKNTGVVTIDGTALGTINGSNTIKLRQYDSVELVSDGTLWVITGSYLPAQASLAISALDIDWSLASIFSKTLGANSTFTFSNTSDGVTIIVALTNTASNYTVTWPTVAWAAGTPPTQTIGAKTDLYTFVKIGAIFYGSVVQNMS